MRTIGKKNITMVKKLTRSAVKKNQPDIEDYVISQIPESVFAIWEDSYSEIERIIFDTVSEIAYKE